MKIDTQNHSPKIGVLIVNLGTPDSPRVPDVRKYLREFLMDWRVVDVPYILRFILVNGIIAPFRSPKSAKEYRKLFTEEGSPLKFYGERVEKKLQDALGEQYIVKLGMRYQSPSIKSSLDALNNQGLEKIIVIPLFPQYASASSGSVHDKVMQILRTWQVVPEIDLIHNFYDHPLFTKAFAEIGKSYMEKEEYDHFLFSYHGLPERQLRKADCSGQCLKAAKADKTIRDEANCCASIHALNRSCYRAQCFETTRLLTKALNIPEDKYTVAFQSRLGQDEWIKPYTEDKLKEFAKGGIKKVLAFSPAFVSDCLETTIEIGEEYKEKFEEAGGEHWQLVDSLNEHPLWIELLKDLAHQHSNIQKRMSYQPQEETNINSI
jgi:ferrochelatase